MGNVAEGHASFFTVLATEDFSESFECAAPSANINTVFILIFFLSQNDFYHFLDGAKIVWIEKNWPNAWAH